MLNNEIIFERLGRAQMATLVSKISSLSQDEPWMDWRIEDYLTELPKKWQYSTIVRRGEQVLGYALCSMRGNLVWLHRIVTDANHRSEGLGRELLAQSFEIARKNGLKGLILKTPSTNHRTISFYLRNGFQRLHDQGDYAIFRRLTDHAKVAVGVHQPNYIPWLGYFYKMAQSDIFIFLDNVKYPTRSFVNRNKILINGAPKWLTVPLKRNFDQLISETFTDGDQWKEKHLRSIELSYRRTPYFETYFEDFSNAIHKHKDCAISLINEELLRLMASWLGINSIFYRASQLNASSTGDERLVQLVQDVGGHIYVSGTGGANYQSEATFNKAEIQLVYSKFLPFEYPQAHTGFTPALAALDAFFNIGRDGILDGFNRAAHQE